MNVNKGLNETFSPIYNEKLNIFIYWLNKLENVNIGFLLYFVLKKIGCRKYIYQKEKCIYVVSQKNSEAPKQDIEVYKTDDGKELDYIEADDESHGGEILCELFCVTEKDLELIDMDSIFDNDKMVI